MYQILDFMEMLAPQQKLTSYIVQDDIIQNIRKNFEPTEINKNLVPAVLYLNIPVLKECFNQALQQPCVKKIQVPKNRFSKDILYPSDLDLISSSSEDFSEEDLESSDEEPVLGFNFNSIQKLFTGSKSFSLVCNQDKKISGISLHVLRQSRSIAFLIEDLGEAINNITEIPVFCDKRDMEKIVEFMKILAEPSEFIAKNLAFGRAKNITELEFEWLFINYVRRQVCLANFEKYYKLVYWLDIPILEKAFVLYKI